MNAKVLGMVKVPETIAFGGKVQITNVSFHMVESGKLTNELGFPVIDGIRIKFDIKINFTLNGLKMQPYIGSMYRTYAGEEFERIVKHLNQTTQP